MSPSASTVMQMSSASGPALAGEHALSLQMRRLMNKMCPQQCETIAAQVAAMNIETHAELGAVAGVLASSACRDPVNSKCYCAMIQSMQNRFSAFNVDEFLAAVQCSLRDQFAQFLHQQLCANVTSNQSIFAQRHERIKFSNSARLAAQLFLQGLAPENYLRDFIQCLVKCHVPRRAADVVPMKEALEEPNLAVDIFLLSGARCVTKAKKGETTSTLAIRLADELVVATERLHFIGPGGTSLPPDALLDDLLSPSGADCIRCSLQVVVLPLAPKDREIAAECMCEILELLTDGSRKVTLAPMTAPRRAAIDSAAPTSITPPCLEPLRQKLLSSSDTNSRQRLIVECAGHLLAVLSYEGADGKPVISKRVQFRIEDTLSGCKQLC